MTSRLATLLLATFTFTALLAAAPAQAQQSSSSDVSLGVAPHHQTSDASGAPYTQQEVRDPDPLTAYSTSLSGNFAGQFVRFELDNPPVLTPIIASSEADTAFAGDFAPEDSDTFFIIENESNALLEVDRQDGTTTMRGTATPGSGETWTELAADPVSTLFYGSTATSSNSYLYTVDENTGATVQIAEVTLSGNSVPGLIAIAIDESGQMYGYEVENDTFLQIDKATGIATEIGSIGFDADFAQGLDFNVGNDVLYMAAYNASTNRGELRTVDLSDGSTTLVGALGAGGQVGYLAYPSSEASIIPVEFAGAPQATVRGRDVTLRWTTLSEHHNAGFYAEYQRADATTWTTAPERVEGAGTTTAQNDYRYTLADLAPGAYRFRVRQVDLGGATSSTSPTVEATVRADGFALQAPSQNPFRDRTTLTYSAENARHLEAALYNTLGQRVRTLDASGGRIEVRAGALASGLYFVRLTSGDRVDAQSITLVR